MKTIYYDRSIELFNSGQTNKTEISRIICKEFGLEYSDSIRKNVNLYINNRALYEECNNVGIDPGSVNYYWYKGKQFSINASNKIDLNQFQNDFWINNFCQETRFKI